jgi:uncharacterized membrane protein YidH (DUF202 family)
MKKILSALALLILPAVTFGEQLAGQTISDLEGLLQSLVPFIIGIAVFIFIVGLLRYVNAGGDEERIKAARNTIIWGLIIIFVMFSVVGLINLVNHVFSLDNTRINSSAPQVFPN